MPRVEDQSMPKVNPLSAALEVVGTSSCFSSKCPRARGRKQTGISSSQEAPRYHSRALPGGPQQSPTVSQKTAHSLPGKPHNLSSIRESLIGKYRPLRAHIQRPPSKQATRPLSSVQLTVMSTRGLTRFLHLLLQNKIYSSSLC